MTLKAEMGSPINHGVHTAGGIVSSASIETKNTYRNDVEYYKEQEFSYIPLPFSKKYYDIEKGDIHDISDDQYITVDHHLIDCFKALTEEPFLLVYPLNRGVVVYEQNPQSNRVHKLDSNEDSIWIEPVPYPRGLVQNASITENEFDTHDLDLVKDRKEISIEDAVSQYPQFRNSFLDHYDGVYEIITLPDLNKRKARQLPFNIIAELEISFANLIEEEYPESRELFVEAHPETIGRWEKARMDDVEVHIAEYMTLSGLKKVIRKSDSLLEKCGQPSGNQFKKQVSGLVDLRNRVMHTNRTLVRDQDDLKEVVSRMKRAEEAIELIKG